MSPVQILKNKTRKIRQWPQKFCRQLYASFPNLMGHMIHGSPVQLYRHDAQFTTAVSFNHFIEFFSNIPKMTITADIEVFCKDGKLLGKKSFTLEKKGSFQFLLSDLFENLDQYGLFSVSMTVLNGYIPELSYLGILYPQYMTILIPTDQLSSAQMIHSHKLKQGHLWTKRSLKRESSNIEISDQIQKLDFYFLNSSASPLLAQLDIHSAKDGRKIQTLATKIPGYGTGLVTVDPQNLEGNTFCFEYHFDRNVDHKKPILFRQFLDQSWSCNHT